jgi:phospholipid-binding lipoprotein MlaA
VALVVAFALALVPVLARADAPPDPLFAEEDAGEASEPQGFPDPLEGLNRVVFRMNRGVDDYLIDPLTTAYCTVVPGPARRAVRRALANLDAPAVFVNDVLQLAPRDAGTTAARFAVNTTVGVVGLFDVAERMGLEAHSSDFGQTLALYGVPSGAFLVLPVLGPTNVRDGTGFLVDVLFHPMSYILTPGATVVYASIQEGTAGFTARAAHGDELKALEASSMDYYAALRSAFYQNRMAEIYTRREEWRPVTVAKR